ncbi:type II CAAX endopeptidase family protein [Niallia sp. XMNu-256]|uniref:CPBP family intramembrane glutamic endopeptidase n=1 Tax=Niallia sp. XMNu-256 TaxID=3082444 RepID=UPI0030CB626F
MKREYGIILIIYIGMHLSGIIGSPLLLFFSNMFGYSMSPGSAVTSWLLISFSIAFVFILFHLRKEIHPIRNEQGVIPLQSIFWGISGIFLAFFAQSIAITIEMALGIEMGSENTQQIVGLIQAAPLVIIITSIIGPILEEIVFRKILFGSLYKKLNFFLAALISSLIFSLAHGEPEHLILYGAMGFTFAFLYVKTKQILVPIFTHVAMNTIVVIMQLNPNLMGQL